MGNFESNVSIYLEESGKTIQKKSLYWTQNYAIHPHQKHKKDISQCCSSISSVIRYIQKPTQCHLLRYRGKSPIMWRFPNMGRCIISHQVLRSLLKNVNHQAAEAVLRNHSINGQLLRTSVLTGRLCFGAL